MNVLVVEDERNLADAIVRIVSDAGFNCEAVYDGNAVRRRIQLRGRVRR